uniref:transcriptional regulator ATRX-like n=1 Tax=Myxine glutinosa TaxID=7769 RepID=UPI00358FFE51
MTSKRKSNKLDTLVQKLQDFATQSVPEDDDAPDGSKNCSGETEDILVMPPFPLLKDEEPASPSLSRSRRKPAHVVKVVASDEDGEGMVEGKEDDVSDHFVTNELENIEDSPGDGANGNWKEMPYAEGSGNVEPGEGQTSVDQSLLGKSDAINIEDLPEGTVVVQPQPVQDDDRDTFRGPEFRQKGRGRPDGLNQDIVTCTSCGSQVNRFRKSSLFCHPILNVLLCKTCYLNYMSEDIDQDAEGTDEQCRWCAQGGKLICCDYCNNAFCRSCVQRNFGRAVLHTVISETDRKWHCYVCDPEPLRPLIVACKAAFKHSQEDTPGKRRPCKHRGRTGWPDDANDCDMEEDDGKSKQENRGLHLKCATTGEKALFKFSPHYSGGADHYKDLILRREAFKMARQLSEASQRLAGSFLALLSSEHTDTSGGSRKTLSGLQSLRAFRAVLIDLHKDQSELQLRVEEEIRIRKSKEQEWLGQTLEMKNSKTKKVKNADEGKCIAAMKEKHEVDMKNLEDSPRSNRLAEKAVSNMEDCKPQEDLVEAQDQTMNLNVNEKNKQKRKLRTNGEDDEEICKDGNRVHTKEVVKETRKGKKLKIEEKIKMEDGDLDPMQEIDEEVEQLHKSESELTKKGVKDVIHSESKKENERKLSQANKRTEDEKSEAEHIDFGNQDSQDLQNKNVNVNASAETSDSDEMPDVLKHAHHNCTTSSDSVESDSKPKRRGIKCLHGSLTSKRKRRASSDLSDTKKKGKQVKKCSNKWRRQDDDDNTVVHSDSSNFDSDLEKEIAGFCSLPANRKSRKKKQSEGNEEEGEGNSQESDNATCDGPLGSGDNSETGLSELLAKKKGKGQGKKEKMMKTKDAKKEKVTSSEMSEDEDEAAKKAEDGEDEQLSSDDETQQIRPITENAQHPQGNLMQSSGAYQHSPNEVHTLVVLRRGRGATEQKDCSPMLLSEVLGTDRRPAVLDLSLLVGPLARWETSSAGPNGACGALGTDRRLAGLELRLHQKLINSSLSQGQSSHQLVCHISTSIHPDKITYLELRAFATRSRGYLAVQEELNGRNSDVVDEDSDSEDDLENRIAKKMLLREIMCGQLSDENSSSNADSDGLLGGKTTFGKNGKKSGKKRKGQDVNDDDEEEGEDYNEEDDDEGSVSDFEVGRKSRYRHHLLRHKVTESDSDKGKAKLKKKKKKKHSSKEEDDEDEDGDKKGKPKGKGNRHSTSTAESSDDAESEAESDCDSESDGDSVQKSELDEDGSSSGEYVKKKSYHPRSNKKAENKKQRSYKGKKKKRRIKVQDSSSGSDKVGSDKESEGSDDDDQKSTGYGRKKIREIIKDDKLRGVTQQALKEEEERRNRVADREKERMKLREVSEVIVMEDSAAVACPITTKLVLEEDAETKEALVQVHHSLVCKLKPHQVDGVQFMWDCCIETVKKTQKEGGSGCIVAHCMGLGKTLQVVAFLHTVLRTEVLKFRNALIVCPLNTILNWINEFQIWLGDIEDGPQSFAFLQVRELTTVKRMVDRARMLRQWMDDGGIMIMGYEMYRNLTSGHGVKSKKQRETIVQSLVDPGPDFVICDEGHILKNELSAISKAMNAIRTRRRIVLTGTPLQNNLLEYHCMVNFIKENLLGTSREFCNRFINPIQNGQCSDSTLSDVRIMKKRAHILYELLAGCVQRKDYTALTKFLPPKHEYVLSIRLSPLQCQLYRHYLDHFSGTVGRGGIAGKSRAGTKIFTDFQMLSRIWTHPWCLQLDYISKEKRAYFDAEDSMDDEDSSVVCLSDSEPSTSKKKARGKKRTGWSDEKKKVKSKNNVSEGVEVVKVWNTRSRGSGGQQEIVESAMPDADNTIKNEDESAPPAVAECTHAAEWYKEFVKEEDAEKLEHSGKLHILFEILRMVEELNEKVLVFSQSLISLDLIEGFLKLSNNESTDDKPNPYKGTGKWYRNIDYYRMDGSTSAMRRKKLAEDFNDEVNTRGRLFLISTKAGSLGINLVAANRVIVFDASWNPSYDIQSIFRVYRFGQNKHVFVYRFLAQGTLVSQGTVTQNLNSRYSPALTDVHMTLTENSSEGTMEEKIYDRQVTKQSLSFRVVDQQQVERHFTMHELSELYCFEPDHLDDPNTKKKKRPTLRLPKDRILAELLQESKHSIVEYHEHDSLLDHKQEEELTEEERKAAWAELFFIAGDSNNLKGLGFNSVKLSKMRGMVASPGVSHSFKLRMKALEVDRKGVPRQGSPAAGHRGPINSHMMWAMDYPNRAAMHGISAQQLQDRLNESRARVNKMHKKLATHKLETFEDVMRRLSESNHSLSASQMLDVCAVVQRNQQVVHRRLVSDYQQLVATHHVSVQNIALQQQQQQYRQQVVMGRAPAPTVSAAAYPQAMARYPGTVKGSASAGAQAQPNPRVAKIRPSIVPMKNPKPKKKAKGKKHTGRSDEEKKVKSENSDSEGLEVVKVWNTRSRGGGGQQEIGESATPDAENTIKNEDESAPPAVAECTHAAEWYKEFVKEDDADKLEHSGKLHILFEILRMAEELTEKVLVFSQSLISLDLIEGFLKLSNNECTDDKPNPYKGPGKWYRNIDYYRMDGSTSAMTRKKWAEDFNDEVNTRGRLFLISTKAGSLGINLVAANRVIVFDASWNPSYDIQSIFRVYRFGQNKHVFVYRFLAQGTMEEKIYDRQVTKQSLSFRVVDQQQVERHFTMHELSELYNFEPDHLDDPNTKKKKRPTPRLPKDRILAELLQESKDSIVEYHEHDSLLDHKQEEELTEEERKAAWAEYEAEKKGVPRQGPPAAGHTGLINSHMMWAMDYPNPAAMHNTSAQQLQDLLNESRARVNEAHNILATHKVDTFEDVMRRVSEANPSLSESQMLDVCSLVQRNQQAERRRVESNYQQLMARHQVIYQSVQNIALQQQQQQYRQQVAMGRAPAPTVSAEAYRQAMARYPGTVEGRAAAGAQAPPNPRVAETGPSIVPMKNAKP